jgi:CHAT domain
MRTITLELLRHGPSHNQLLSPLTPYMALCENHGAVTLHVPFEHNQLLYRLSSLTYKVNEDSRVFQLQDTARLMGDILSEIPGLTAESSKGEPSEQNLTHLRLILSASELALLPFELALSPQGMPGSGQHLLLQPQMPICLTREVRRVPGERFRWPENPRILFVAAAPPGVGTIPLESHLQALRNVIAPWVKYYPAEPTAGLSAEKVEALRAERVEKHLHFLPAASIQSIEEACSSGEFTHIHILAHGIEQKESFDTRFYLALHDARDPDKADYVSGPRLATALRAVRTPDSRELSRPAVVTLASCDSANVGSVAGAGASVAHALHEAGIPMVVAGQFPLTFQGSVCLVQILYEGLLWGTDPRRLLYDLRRRLYSQFRSTHDWAGLTAYLSLPDDFDEQLSGVKIRSVRGCIDAAMNHADVVTSMLKDEASPLQEDKTVAGVLQKVKGAKEKLERLLDEIPTERCQIYGLLASTEKREAEILHSAARQKSTKSEERDKDRGQAFELLRRARQHYWKAFLLDRSSTWAAVQHLSLTLLMKRTRDADLFSLPATDCPLSEEQPETDVGVLWSLCRLLSCQDIRTDNRQVRVWAHTNLAELYLLSLLMEEGGGRPSREDARCWSIRQTDYLIETDGGDSFDVYSAWRQMRRYQQWFNVIAELDRVEPLVQEILQRFPGGIEEKWK